MVEELLTMVEEILKMSSQWLMSSVPLQWYSTESAT